MLIHVEGSGLWEEGSTVCTITQSSTVCTSTVCTITLSVPLRPGPHIIDLKFLAIFITLGSIDGKQLLEAREDSYG